MDHVTEPRLVQVPITLTYWSCLIPEHRHKSQRVARECIRKTKMPKKTSRRRSLLDKLNVMKAVIHGTTFGTVAAAHHTSAGSAREMFYSTLRYLRRERMSDEDRQSLGLNYIRFRELDGIRDRVQAWDAFLDSIIKSEESIERKLGK